jgi:hypothetical protein
VSGSGILRGYIAARLGECAKIASRVNSAGSTNNKDMLTHYQLTTFLVEMTGSVVVLFGAGVVWLLRRA